MVISTVSSTFTGARQAQNILTNEPHWFNEPMLLPPSMEADPASRPLHTSPTLPLICDLGHPDHPGHIYPVAEGCQSRQPGSRHSIIDCHCSHPVAVV